MAVSRREVLVGAGAVVGAQACATSGTTDSTDPGPATIDTIIVVMMENRSFDHMLGSLKLVEGRAEVDGLTAEMANVDADGVTVAAYPNEVGCVSDPGHGWGSSHDQFNGGLNDGFVKDYGGPEVMGYQRRSDLPITYALADEYALCDRYFCSVMGPTWPNRFYGHCGTSDGMTSNDWPPDGTYPLPNVWAELTAAGVDHAYYFTDLPFLFLIRDAWDYHSAKYLEDFVADAEAGRLPPVVWLDPGFAFNDDHPPHHVAMGQEFLATVYKALARSPQWNNCLLLITYDEHGGFFDHVPPPTTADDHAAEGFDQLGFRVPSIVVGPYVKQGVMTMQFDHTSWLKFVCERHGITPWTARIEAATSLAEVLDTDAMARRQPRPPIELPAFDFDDASLGDECQGNGVVGPPGPTPRPPPVSTPPVPTPPSLPETWHGLMRAVYPEEERTGEWERLAAWIRAYARDEAPRTVFSRRR